MCFKKKDEVIEEKNNDKKYYLFNIAACVSDPLVLKIAKKN